MAEQDPGSRQSAGERRAEREARYPATIQVAMALRSVVTLHPQKVGEYERHILHDLNTIALRLSQDELCLPSEPLETSHYETVYNKFLKKTVVGPTTWSEPLQKEVFRAEKEEWIKQIRREIRLRLDPVLCERAIEEIENNYLPHDQLGKKFTEDDVLFIKNQLYDREDELDKHRKYGSRETDSPRKRIADIADKESVLRFLQDQLEYNQARGERGETADSKKKEKLAKEQAARAFQQEVAEKGLQPLEPFKIENRYNGTLLSYKVKKGFLKKNEKIIQVKQKEGRGRPAVYGSFENGFLINGEGENVASIRGCDLSLRNIKVDYLTGKNIFVTNSTLGTANLDEYARITNSKVSTIKVGDRARVQTEDTTIGEVFIGDGELSVKNEDIGKVIVHDTRNQPVWTVVGVHNGSVGSYVIKRELAPSDTFIEELVYNEPVVVVNGKRIQPNKIFENGMPIAE